METDRGSRVRATLFIPVWSTSPLQQRFLHLAHSLCLTNASYATKGRARGQMCPLCLFKHVGTGAGLWTLSPWSQCQLHCRGVISSQFAETEQGLSCRRGTAMGKNPCENTKYKAIRSVLFLKVQELFLSFMEETINNSHFPLFPWLCFWLLQNNNYIYLKDW